MCVAIPAKITAITADPQPLAQLDLDGEQIEARLASHPEAQIGDYVLVQNGVVVDVIDELSAAESLAAFVALGVLPNTEQLSKKSA